MTYPQWSEAYGRWHTSDYKSWREHTIKAMPPKLVSQQLGMMSEEEVEKLRSFHAKASPKIQILIKKEGQRTPAEMDLIKDLSFIGNALAHLDHWRKSLASDKHEDQAVQEGDEVIPAKPKQELASVNGDEPPIVPDFLDQVQAQIVAYSQHLANATIEELQKIARYSQTVAGFLRQIKESEQLEFQARVLFVRTVHQLQTLFAGPGGKPEPDRPKQKDLESGLRRWAQVIGQLTAEQLEEVIAKGSEENKLTRRFIEDFLAEANDDGNHSDRRRNGKSAGKGRKKKTAPQSRTLESWISLGTEYRTYPATAPDLFVALIRNSAFRENWLPVAARFKLYAAELMDALLEFEQLGEEAWREKYENVPHGAIS